MKTRVSPLPEPCLSAVGRRDPPRPSLFVGDVLYLFSVSRVPRDRYPEDGNRVVWRSWFSNA